MDGPWHRDVNGRIGMCCGPFTLFFLFFPDCLSCDMTPMTHDLYLYLLSIYIYIYICRYIYTHCSNKREHKLTHLDNRQGQYAFLNPYLSIFGCNSTSRRGLPCSWGPICVSTNCDWNGFKDLCYQNLPGLLMTVRCIDIAIVYEDFRSRVNRLLSSEQHFGDLNELARGCSVYRWPCCSAGCPAECISRPQWHGAVLWWSCYG